MHVEAVEKIPKRAENAARPELSQSLAIKNFVAAMESDDSLFTLQEPLVATAVDEPATGQIFSGDVLLAFKEPEHGRRRSLPFQLVEKLIELLKAAGSQETLEAKLCLTVAKRGAENHPENILHVRLLARGDSAEQAALRWGLGIAHLQQALLFTSRHLRQYLTKAGEG